jgi:uncharacterized protein YjbI with pentapeptide repeats
LDNEESLISRWHSLQGSRKAELVKHAILTNNLKLMHTSIELTQDSLFDLRYIPLNFQTSERLSNTILNNIDFSNADLGSLIIENCTFQNCKLDNMKIKKWHEQGNKFEHSSFRNVKFYDSNIGLKGSTYNNVDFSNSDLRNVRFYYPQFKHCAFLNVILNKVDFNASNFMGCKFKGKIISVWFNKTYRFSKDEMRFGSALLNEMDVDFSESTLWDVMFTGGIDLSKVVLPNDGMHMLVRRLDLVTKKISQNIDLFPEDERKTIQIWVKAYSRRDGQSMWIMNKREILDNMGEKAGNTFIKQVLQYDEY